MMRDHYEGTPLALDNDPGMGPFEAPYRPTPLTWEVDGKTYFNERPISTQQSGFVFVAQMRSTLCGWRTVVRLRRCEHDGFHAGVLLYGLGAGVL